MSFRTFVAVCIVVVSIALIVAVALAYHSRMNHAAIDSMIQRGYSPMEAKCATLSSTELKTNGTCLAIAIKSGSKVKTDSEY